MNNNIFSQHFKAYADGFTQEQGGWNSFDENPRQLADVNGDGRADIVGFGNNKVLVSLGQSDGTFAVAELAYDAGFIQDQGGWFSFDENPRQLADVNGDGRADIVGFANNGVDVSLGQSDGTFSQHFKAYADGFTQEQGGWNSFDENPRQLADVNGDGRADIVGFGNNKVLVSLGQSDGTFAVAELAYDAGFIQDQGGWFSFDENPRQLADVNSDGRADIVGFANNGVDVSLGQSDGTFSQHFKAYADGFTQEQGGWNSFDENPRQLADVNGDGRADIVGFGNNKVLVSLGQSDGTFAVAELAYDAGFIQDQGGWFSFDENPRQLADVNGDGRADIVGFANNGVDVSLASVTTDGEDDTDGNDELFGDSGNNEILGGAGNDTLHGQEGNDKLRGESGNDELFGDSGKDKIKGGSGKDKLFGGEGNDKLKGGSGKDTLVGGLEGSSKQEDTLTGGAGKDIFVLGDSNTVGYNLGGNSDQAIITDLAEADKIQLKGTPEDYMLIKNLNLVGAIDLDTAIATIVGDVIGVIQDNTSLINSMSSSLFNYV